MTDDVDPFRIDADGICGFRLDCDGHPAFICTAPPHPQNPTLHNDWSGRASYDETTGEVHRGTYTRELTHET
jgi:hypothetical protein